MFGEKSVVCYFIAIVFFVFVIDQAFSYSNRPRARRIDIHHHLIPSFYVDALLQIGDPSNAPNPPWSVQQSLDQMAQLNVEKAILSVTAPGTKLYENDPVNGRIFARRLNEFTANVVKNNSQKYGYFASLPPLIDVEGALIEINNSQSSIPKPNGYIIYTSYAQKYLGHPSFQPVWAKLNALKTVVFIHPSIAPIPTVNQYLPMSVMDFPSEISRTTSDLVVTGTRAAFPNVKIILAHGAGTIPYLAYRLASVGLIPELQCPRNYSQILEDFQTFYLETGLSASRPQLLAALEFFDSSKILFGADVPHTPFPLVQAITESLDAFFLNTGSRQDRKIWEDINYNNAKRLFGFN